MGSLMCAERAYNTVFVEHSKSAIDCAEVSGTFSIALAALGKTKKAVSKNTIATIIANLREIVLALIFTSV
jgi:hypothetical protein